MSRELRDCVVFWGPDLTPRKCGRFVVEGDRIKEAELGEPVMSLERGGLVIIPGLHNSHTHMGDSALPDGTTGMTLEEGFFRPDGYKYRALAKMDPKTHLDHVTNHLGYMARTGTVCHLDFREQGPAGSGLLREASRKSGVDSVILGQFNGAPFDTDQLERNQDPLPEAFVDELQRVLDVADGFSESTMNDLTDPAWRTIREITEQRGKLRAIHCLENEGYRNDSLRITGIGDLARALDRYAPHLIIHMTVANDEETAMLAASAATATLNPRANANLGLPLPPVARLLKSGANLLLGTDNGLLNSPNMLAEMDFTYKLAKSQMGNAVEPDPLEILRMATTNIRKLLGGDHYGYLDKGLPADFVVLNFHQPHLAHSRHLPASVLTRVTPDDVLATYRHGKPLYESGKMASTW